MKKHDLATLAMIGIGAGIIIGGCQQAGRDHYPKGGTANEQMTPDTQTFYAALSPDAKQKFTELDAQHRMMAMEMANQSCSGKNNCKGMGGCKTKEHACAGLNACKGEGGEPIKDANKAVSVQFDNQMGQRKSINGNMGS